MENTIVVGIGEALWDVLPEGKKIGGAPANFAYHVSQFGLDGRAVSAVGDDKLGAEILENFYEKNLHSMIEKVPYPTGTVQVELDAEGVPCYDIKEGVAWDNIPYTPALEGLAKQTTAVCFGSLAQRSEKPRDAILRLIDAVPDTSLKVFDINIRQHFYSTDLIVESLQKANVLKLNEDELPLLISLLSLSTDFVEAIAELIARFSLKYVIFTQGAVRSGIYDDSGEISSIDTPKVEVADTVGAGDSFTATFVVNILRGASVAESHRKAVDVSAYTCTQRGAINPLPDSKK